MKTKLKMMFVMLFSLIFVIALVACEEQHKHDYGTTYEKDADGHWQICTECNEASEKTAHVYADDKDGECDVCGFTRDVRTYKEKVLDYLEELNNPGDIVSLYGGKFEDIVAALKDAGAIEATDNGIDMNTTAGYMKDATTGTYSTEPVVFADKAYDYNGLWLMYWADESEHNGNIEMIAMSNSVLIGGGAYSLPVDSFIGNYAIAFKTVADIKNVSWTEADGDYAEWKAGRDQLAATELAKYQSKLDAFEALAAPTSVAHYTPDLLINKLREAKYISAQEFIAPTDLNKLYSYTYGDNQTANVSFAHKAVKYGKISIYYFDESDSWWNLTTYQHILDSLKETKTSKVWYDKDGAGFASNFPWYNEEYVYQVDGKDLTFSVDVVYGCFAIAIDD